MTRESDASQHSLTRKATFVAALALFSALFILILSSTQAHAVEDSMENFTLFTQQAGEQYGVSPERLYRMAVCESNLDPNAKGAGGLYTGLFQYSRGTWESNPYFIKYGYEPTSVRGSVWATAWFLSRGEGYHWPNC